uniref:Uncharacterized protein n=1 Tax=Anguilla anguilla TaxID=7936 RepID=A0A0E9XZR1_ANGAN
MSLIIKCVAYNHRLIITGNCSHQIVRFLFIYMIA